jgi:hypothetical protein
MAGSLTRGGGLLAFAASAFLLAAGSATAVPVSGEQFSVSGKQTPAKGDGDSFRMSGGLLGSWEITSFKTVAVKPVFRGKGTELFDGCIDVKRDGSCAGDPSGQLKFKFRYWAKISPHEQVQLGTCSHPVTGGSGDFAGATGFLMMVDTPIKKPPLIVTHYEGVITLGKAPIAARRLTDELPPSPC